jgi:hypothetical protein
LIYVFYTTIGINPIFANSPQAKGRVERMWNTLQDRLTVYFKKNGINTVEKANEMLPEFIKAKLFFVLASQPRSSR